jgi:hypothetical protein
MVLSAFSHVFSPKKESSTIVSKLSRSGPSPSFLPTTHAEAAMEGGFGKLTLWLPTCFLLVLNHLLKNEKSNFAYSPVSGGECTRHQRSSARVGS